MTGAGYHLAIVLALMAVPVAWLVPRRLAFDGVAAWTAVALGLLSPATLLWLLAIAIGLPFALRGGGGGRGPRAVVICVVLVAGLVVSRGLPGWAWIGGAFFTLRALHVVLDWWMGRMEAPGLRDSLRYFLFMPVIAAGPVNRLPHFQHQLRRRRWDGEMFATGAERLLRGLVLFYVVSGYVMHEVQAGPDSWGGDTPGFATIWAVSAVSWVDLYFAFAGSTDIALGIALMTGLRLEENFDRPWASRDLVEFWTRWHMTLTHWVRDYVFRPVTALTRRPVLGLVAAMLVVGLWHEFSVYYILWSGWQSLGVILSRLARTASGDRRPPPLVGTLAVLAWLSAARPVIAMFGVMP